MNSLYTYLLTFEDEDPDDIHLFTFTTMPSGMTFDGSRIDLGEVRISWTPDESQHDIHAVLVSLSDGHLDVTQGWVIQVLFDKEPESNVAPVFVSIPIKGAITGFTYLYDADAVDDNNDTLYYRLINGPEGASIDRSTGLVTWDPPGGFKDHSEDHEVVIEVTDGHVKVTQTYALRHRYPDNQAPGIKGIIPDVDTSGEHSYKLGKHMYDPDDPVSNLTWYIEGGDADLFVATLDGNTLEILPRDGAQGSAAITLILEDPSGDRDSKTVVVTVAPWHLQNASYLLILLVIILVITFATYYTYRRRQHPKEPGELEGDVALVAASAPEPDIEVNLEPGPEVDVGTPDALAGEGSEDIIVDAGPAPVEGVAAGAGVLAVGAVKGPLTYLVEEVFVVYNDGRLMVECAREECKTQDADLMSGMLIAIQGLIQDGLERGGVLESIKYGDSLILMATGEHIHLAAVVFGTPDDELSEEMENTVRNIEASYAGVIENWTGDLGVISGIEPMVYPLIERTL
ncbi:MAG: hypothetical protein LN414_03210, partial [Candidatus Thermoplasmatota archaeon]|nr:hypothetical protein [Candidatus Thermoplasmatota archaeon]